MGEEKENCAFPVVSFVKINAVGQVTVPIKVREQNEVKDGDLLEVRWIRKVLPTEEKQKEE